MKSDTSRGQRFLYRSLAIAIVLFFVIGALLLRAINDTAKGDLSGQTQATAATSAQSIANSIENLRQLSQALTGQDGVLSILGGTADQGTVNRVSYSFLGVLKAFHHDLAGVSLFDNNRQFVFGEVYDLSHQFQKAPGASCNRDGYCSLTNPPMQGYLATGQLQADLNKELQTKARPSERLVFGAGAGPLGDIYLFQPVAAPGGKGMAGVLVAQVDATAIFRPYIQQGTSGSLIVDGNIVIGPGFDTAVQQGLLPVTQIDPTLNVAISGGLRQTTGLVPAPGDSMLNNDTPHFTVNGTDVQGSVAAVPDTLSSLRVVSYTAPSAISASAGGVIIAAGLFFLAMIIAILVVFFTQNRRVQHSEQAAATLLRARSDALTEDIVSVSQALAVAREGDLTVEVPASDSEVGLLSLSLNGLINDYGLIVGGIIHASQAVQEGAARVDEGVRRIVDVATSQAESVALVAASVEEVATSAVEVQQGTQMATTLAANARQAVNSGQESVSRIAEAVDAIKEAAIGTTREFKRLQEDSIRLTALVASVKSNAENLDMQAANATLEARHLGTESGSAFATNIGRLARQAQDTLADAEGAVRSVVTSIDEVNRRIERISEQVRRGVEEVRTVRSTFEQVTQTNASLVQFIDNVADAAGIQAQSALQAAHSISEIAQVFEQFTELLITSGDEIANMRLIVASLRESVADLKVGDADSAPETRISAESAA